MMRAWCSIFTGILFFVWILPLGAFIKPSDEKKACNGKRAICLCSHLFAKQTAKYAGKTLLKNASSAGESSNGVPSSHFYVNALLAIIKNSDAEHAMMERAMFYANPTQETASPVPKVSHS